MLATIFIANLNIDEYIYILPTICPQRSVIPIDLADLLLRLLTADGNLNP